MSLNNGNTISISTEINLISDGRNLKSPQCPFRSTPYRGLLSKTTSFAGGYLLLSNSSVLTVGHNLSRIKISMELGVIVRHWKYFTILPLGILFRLGI